MVLLSKQQKIVVRQAVKNNTILNRLKTKKKKSIIKLTNQVKDAAPGSRKRITKTAAVLGRSSLCCHCSSVS